MKRKTKGAVLFEAGKPWQIVELDLDEPREEEIVVKFTATGLCHSEVHAANGNIKTKLPLVGGHEAAGIVEEVGSRVTRVRPGDKVITTFAPSCGVCEYCSTGRQSICVLTAGLATGELPAGGFRFHHRGQDVASFSMLGSFAERAVISQYSVVKVAPSTDLLTAALFSCGIPTGWGTAAIAGNVEPGEVVVIFGAGGIGMNAVQGAAYSGASEVIVVEPVRMKRELAKKFGATQTFATAQEAITAISSLTGGVMADKALVTVGEVTSEVALAAQNSVGRSGEVVITSLAKDTLSISAPSDIMLVQQKVIRGALYGSTNPQFHIPHLLALHRSGDLKVDGLITRTYSLDQINTGYQDLLNGDIVRGMVVYK